ncbi:MAG TPA: phosphopantetheine-binding protein, partial [Ktedonobacterales bacterium]|nr:phosphopantetheine-binding protein [Ktedonobacterales bacterium]
AALPAPDATNMLGVAAVVAPTTPVEERLVTIVAATLGLAAAQVGIYDNFFLLGGHSLSGTQVITRIADMFGVELSLHALFTAPTIAELSLEVERLILARLDAMSEDEIQSLLAYPSDGRASAPLNHEVAEGAVEAQS